MGCGTSLQPIEQNENNSDEPIHEEKEEITKLPLENIEKQYNIAIDDFMYGTSLGKLSPKNCELLMKYNKNIRNCLNKSFIKKLDSISIMPYGTDIIIAENPSYIGPYSQEMYMANKDHKMTIYFDRN